MPERAGRSLCMPINTGGSTRFSAVPAPAFKRSPDDDFIHTHGGMTLEDAMLEAIMGEVDTNLFTHGSTRMLAIISLGEHIVFPNGRKHVAVLAVRAGMQLRPAHLLAY